MARKSQHTFSKRQREQKKAEKAAQKRDRRAARGNPDEPGPEVEETGAVPEDATSDVETAATDEPVAGE